MKKILILLVIFIFNKANSQSEFWGMTSNGGSSSAGVIYKTDGNGSNETVEYSFFEKEGNAPMYTAFIQASDGKLYGMTMSGGLNGFGVLFQYNPVTNIYVKKFDFDGALNGSSPAGSLMEASDGNLYGMTSTGGTSNLGVLFQFNPTTNVYTKKMDFIGTANGANPQSSLIQATDGNLYGMTEFGGSANAGVLFQYNLTTDAYVKKIDFNNGIIMGRNPQGSLIQASDGMLYGMTDANMVGNIFQFNPVTNAYTVKFDFDGIAGHDPQGSLVQASDGMLYGMTVGNNTSVLGTIFQFDPITSVCVNKFTFSGSAMANGAYPNGSLIQATDGNLYGMTNSGGNSSSSGVIFQYNPVSNLFTKKYDFLVNHGHPNGSFMQATDGKLYAMNQVEAFQYNYTSNAYAVKVLFGEAINGSHPLGSLVQATNGLLYGLTSDGGANKKGVLFMYDPVTHLYTKKVDFAGTTNGSFPNGSLIQASDGKLYGMTYSGGVNSDGVLFQYNPLTNIYTKKIDFAYSAIGAIPKGSLVEASDGKLYGVTTQGGASGKGVLFQYDPITNILVKKIDFNGTNGNYPSGQLIQASDGKMYGLAYQGGIYNYGTLFQYDIVTNTLLKKYDFSLGNDGHYPAEALTVASDGKLYGLTHEGGPLGCTGVLFQYDHLNNIYTTITGFQGINGHNPSGSLLAASDGNLYGTTRYSGLYGKGVIFQYNPISTTRTITHNFNGIDGSLAMYSNLIELSGTSVTLKETMFNSFVTVSPNPTNGSLTINSKTELQKIEVVSITGQVLVSEFPTNISHTLHLEDFANGIYFVNVYQNNHIVKREKIILNK